MLLAAETLTKSVEKYSVVCAGRRTHENVGKKQHATKKINGQHTRKLGRFFFSVAPKTDSIFHSIMYENTKILDVLDIKIDFCHGLSSY